MAGWTNKGKMKVLDMAFRNTDLTNMYVALCTSGSTPYADIDTMSQLVEIVAGNGYNSGGYQLTRNSTDFDVLNEDDNNDRAEIQLKDIVWSASGGPIPASGGGARWAVLTDDNATVADREVYIYWDLVSDRQVSDGQDLTLQNCEIRITES